MEAEVGGLFQAEFCCFLTARWRELNGNPNDR